MSAAGKKKESVHSQFTLFTMKDTKTKSFSTHTHKKTELKPGRTNRGQSSVECCAFQSFPQLTDNCCQGQS